MKILVVLAVVFLVSTQLFAEEIRTNDGLNFWSNIEQVKGKFLQRFTRKPKTRKFFGLMGKRDADSSTEKELALLNGLYGGHDMSQKRYRPDSFVGLMGKRAFNSVAYDTSAMQNYERRRK